MASHTTSFNDIDESLQRAADAIFQQEGRTAADVYRHLLLRTVEQQHTPPGLYRPNAETLEAMRELDEGGGACFDSVEALMADLNADD